MKKTIHLLVSKESIFSMMILLIISCTHISKEDSELKLIGYIGTSNTNLIKNNSWTIGCEVLDRDYTDYFSYNSYLSLLGAKTARLQLGWAKCEKQKGIYDFEWLDAILADLKEKGIRPWLQFSYGNPIYEGGGEPNLAGGMPYSEEALEAWDNWVSAIMLRYCDYTNYWEVWNEPNLPNKNDSVQNPETYGRFFIRTAENIKRLQSSAFVSGLVICGMHWSTFEYITGVLDYLQKMGKLNLLNEITYHPYPQIPEETYPMADSLRTLLLKYSPEIRIKHGETGSPSGYQENGPLSKQQWTEISQSKWLLRRMVGDYANNIPTSVFTIIDYSYPVTKSLYNEGYIIRMGLLATDSLKRVSKVKSSFFAVQNAINILDDKWQIADKNYITIKIKNDSIKSGDIFKYSFVQNDSNKNMIIAWLGNENPQDSAGRIEVDLILQHTHFEEPVLIDLLKGEIFSIPGKKMIMNADSIVFIDIPLYDSPILIMDKKEIRIVPERMRTLTYMENAKKSKGKG